jgi:hypothetical protein
MATGARSRVTAVPFGEGLPLPGGPVFAQPGWVRVVVAEDPPFAGQGVFL